MGTEDGALDAGLEVTELELRVLALAAAGDHMGVVEHLHHDFREFGASGRVWNRDSIAEALAPGEELPAVSDLSARLVAGGAVLVTYRAEGQRAGASLRSSLWVRDAQGWRLLFHQGTPAVR